MHRRRNNLLTAAAANGKLSDEYFMARALQLAARGFPPHPNPRVGCVVAHNGEIVGEGRHRAAGELHAEIVALQNAGDRARGATLYCTLEPCNHRHKTPPCAPAIIAAGIKRAVVAMPDPNPRVDGGGINILKEAGIETTVGVGAAAAEKLNRGFCKRMRRNRPWVTLKMAATMDGKTALANGRSQWITAPAARRDAHKLRAAHAAILTGVGTVLRDDPRMTARPNEDGRELARQPLKIILDGNGKTPAHAKILRPPGAVLIFTAAEKKHFGEEIAGRKNVEIIGARACDGRLDLVQVLDELARREINDVLVEAGPRLSGSFFAQKLADEIIIYLAPELLGHDAQSMFHLPKLTDMADKPPMRFVAARRVGRDLRITLAPADGATTDV